MSETRLNVRRAGLAIAAAAALTVGTAPFAAAQDTEEAAAGSLNTESATDDEDSLGGGSLGISADPVEKSCELPSLGGSVDAILPYAGLSLPGSVENILIQGLDTIDNPLETAGVDISELGVGSLEGPICSVLLGGEMTEVPETTEETTTSSAEDDETEGEETEGEEAEGDDAVATTSQVPTASDSE